MSSSLQCSFCGKQNFANLRGLQQHQQRSALCRAKLNASFKLPLKAAAFAHDLLQMSAIIKGKQATANLKTMGLPTKQVAAISAKHCSKASYSTNKHTFAQLEAESLEFTDEDDNIADAFDSQSDDEATAAENTYQVDSDDSTKAFQPDNSLHKEFLDLF